MFWGKTFLHDTLANIDQSRSTLVYGVEDYSKGREERPDDTYNNPCREPRYRVNCLGEEERERDYEYHDH